MPHVSSWDDKADSKLGLVKMVPAIGGGIEGVQSGIWLGVQCRRRCVYMSDEVSNQSPMYFMRWKKHMARSIARLYPRLEDESLSISAVHPHCHNSSRYYYKEVSQIISLKTWKQVQTENHPAWNKAKALVRNQKERSPFKANMNLSCVIWRKIAAAGV